jgi:Aspartic acid proteinase inhibitor
MKKRLSTVIIFFVLYLAFGGMMALMAQQQPQVGGYQDAPKADPAIVAAAKAAVSERQQKEGGSITLVKIKRAETQLVAGVNYRLCLNVKANGKTQTATVVVNKTLDDKYSLTSWEAGGCKKHSK